MFLTRFLSKQVDKYNHSHRLSSEQYEQMLPRFEEDSKIANNIFQIYLWGKDSVSEDSMSRLEKLAPSFVDNIRALQENNPEYHYRLFDDLDAERFIFQYYGDTIWSYYQRIDNAYLAAKADFLRYLILYALGGVYLDLKSTIKCSLRETLQTDDKFIFFHWPDGGRHYYLLPKYIEKGEIMNAFIISARGHIFLRNVILNILQQIDLYNPYINGIEWAGTLSITGPALYTKSVYHSILHSSDETYYRESSFDSFGYCVDFSGSYTPGVYQKKLSMKDYRKTSRPLVICKKTWLQTANVGWLKILDIYVRLTRGKVK